MAASLNIRKGFTLVELLVVMTLIAILAAIAIRFLPNAATAQREARAATQLQAWLNIAKQRALRDQAPRGLRLWVNNNYYVNGMQLTPVVTDCQYIEQPDDFTGGTLLGVGNVIQINGADDLLNGYTVSAADQKYWLVQPDDYLEVMGTGLTHRITAVTTANTFAITPPLAYPITTPTKNYRILRSPRVVGDEVLKLPENTLVDLGTNATYGNPTPPINPALGTGYVDILFAPNGSVISRGVATPNIHLWVRAPVQDQPLDVFRGDPTIVSIFVRTGLVGAYRTNPTVPPGPYDLVK